MGISLYSTYLLKLLYIVREAAVPLVLVGSGSERSVTAMLFTSVPSEESESRLGLLTEEGDTADELLFFLASLPFFLPDKDVSPSPSDAERYSDLQISHF